MNHIDLKAYAKINLGLDVVGKREDGYHEVRMIMQTIRLYDKISIHVTNSSDIILQSNLPYLPTNENNLVYKAAKLILNEFHIKKGLQITLEKRIPVAAGLAGGSSDCAAALIGLNKLFHLNLKREQLMKLGVSLGADVPFCIHKGTALSEGIGEILTPLPPVPQCYVLVVKPHMHVSTKFVYENLKLEALSRHPDIDGIVDAISGGDLYELSKRLENVLESVSIKEYPVIGKIKRLMLRYGAINSLMSGSGPTVFGLFDNLRAAKKCYHICRSIDKTNKVFLTDFYN